MAKPRSKTAVAKKRKRSKIAPKASPTRKKQRKAKPREAPRKKPTPKKPAVRKAKPSPKKAAPKKPKKAVRKPSKAIPVRGARPGATKAKNEAKNARAREARRLERERAERQRETRNRRRRELAAQRRAARPSRSLEVQAEDWLRRIRDDMEPIISTTLTFRQPGGGAANLADDQGIEAAVLASRTPWFYVGRFDIDDGGATYQDIARALAEVERDYVLEVAIHPQRLSQIRLVFRDVNTPRSETDSVVSRIGAWSFIVSDMITELVGGTAEIDDPADGSLADRYETSTVPYFYIFFSRRVEAYGSVDVAGPFAGGGKKPKTRTIRLE